MARVLTLNYHFIFSKNEPLLSIGQFEVFPISSVTYMDIHMPFCQTISLCVCVFFSILDEALSGEQ